MKILTQGRIRLALVALVAVSLGACAGSMQGDGMMQDGMHGGTMEKPMQDDSMMQKPMAAPKKDGSKSSTM